MSWGCTDDARGSGALGRMRATAALVAVVSMVSLVSLVSLWCGAEASAAAPKPITAGTPFAGGPPSVAVDAAGDAIVAWANTKDLAGASNFVQYCVIPVGATACTHSGNLTPADAAQFIDGVQVLSDGGTIVILADVFGAAGDNAQSYEPEQEWQSTDGGATFTIVDGGLSVSSGIIDADTEPLSAVILPGTGVLGYGWDTAAGPPTFNAFPLAGPPQCSAGTGGCAAGFATLEPDTNPDVIGNGGGQYAAQQGALPGVMGIFDTDFTNGPLGCSNAQTVPFGTAYAYGSGPQSAANNYNISPGSPGSAWKVAAAQADCNVENPAVGGGPSGFGVLEVNDLTKTTVYHRFNAATLSFDTPMVTVAGDSELSPSVSQDGSGGVYATYLLGGPGGPVALSYSGDGGKSWTGGTLDSNSGGGIGSLDSSVNAAGQGWVAWLDNGSVFAQSLKAADAVTPAVVGGGASSNGTTVTIDVGCASFPCTITITLTGHETVVIKAEVSRVAEKKTKHKTKTVKRGTGRFTITSTGTKKLSVKLSGAGRRFLASKHGHVKISALISERIQRHTAVTTRTLRVAVKTKKKK